MKGAKTTALPAATKDDQAVQTLGDSQEDAIESYEL